MPNINAPAWKALLAHRDQISGVHLRDLFAADPDRFKRFSVELDGLLVDFSKQRLDDEALRLLIDLAETARLAVAAGATDDSPLLATLGAGETLTAEVL